MRGGHGNIDSVKCIHPTSTHAFRRILPWTPFWILSCGFFVMTLFQGIWQTPSWQTFTYLACGWALARDHHTVTAYLWLTGATTAKHFSRFSCVPLVVPSTTDDGNSGVPSSA